MLTAVGDFIPGKLAALVDTGADFTAFPHEYMKRMGIAESDCEEVDGGTAGGKVKRLYYPSGGHIIFRGKKIKVAAFFNEGLPLILLGRGDFLVHYEASFNERLSTMTLTSYETEPENCPVEALAKRWRASRPQ